MPFLTKFKFWHSVFNVQRSTFKVLFLLTSLLSAEEGPTSPDIGLYLQGRAVFEQQCSPCHGRTGRGDGEWSKDVPDQPRNFRSGTFKFRTTPPGFLPTAADLERTIRTGISGTMMPAFTQLSEHDVKSVLTYIRTFSPRWKKPDNYHLPVPLPDLPDWFQDATSFQTRITHAAPLFQAMCATCHGTSGKSDGHAAASLVDLWQHPSNLPTSPNPIAKADPALKTSSAPSPSASTALP